MTGLDHLIVGIDDLERGIAWIERLTGVRAAFGGAHPGRGTRNALLALGPSCYLEIMAPDPQQSTLSWFPKLLAMSVPRLMTWAVHTENFNALAYQAAEAGLLIDGPHEGSRARPDGKILQWKLLRLREDRGGMLPFFIEWGRESVHPAVDAPPGCTLERFELQSPNPPELDGVLRRLSVEANLVFGEEPRMFARILSPKGEVELTS